jgi:hypothetical protein
MNVLRLLSILCLLSALILSAPNRSQAFVLTLEDVNQMLSACPAVTTSKMAEVMKGEVFAFLKSSMSNGAGNLLTLGSTFVLSKRYVSSSDSEYAAYTDCATQQAVKFLQQVGIRIIRNIGEQDTEFQNKNLAFMPTLFFTSISAYQPVRVSKDFKTIVEFKKITCNAKFSAPYVVYPLHSYQPGYEPPDSVERPITTGSKIELDRGSHEVVMAIEESKQINTKEPEKSGFKNYVDANPNELWIWVFLTSTEKSCSASMSVREEPKK